MKFDLVQILPQLIMSILNPELKIEETMTSNLT